MNNSRTVTTETEPVVNITPEDLALIEFPQHEIDRMAAFFLRKKQEESDNDYL